MRISSRQLTSIISFICVITLGITGVALLQQSSSNNPDSSKLQINQPAVTTTGTAVPGQVLPCNPLIGPNGELQLNCTSFTYNKEEFSWHDYAQVNTSCPINEVDRSPYPRTMVTLNTDFTLKPQDWPKDEKGNWSKAVEPYPGSSDFPWRNLTIGLRSRRIIDGSAMFGVTIPKPEWTFTDWSKKSIPTQLGETARYIYKTASFGAPRRGRRFDFTNDKPSSLYDLPAFEVKLVSYCVHEVSVKWEECRTRLTPTAPSGTSPTSPPGSGTVCDWKAQQLTWTPVNLVLYGYAKPYAKTTQSKSGGVFPGTPLAATPYVDAIDGIWVPVIEVQSVLRNPSCAFDGVCLGVTATPDPNASPTPIPTSTATPTPTFTPLPTATASATLPPPSLTPTRTPTPTP